MTEDDTFRALVRPTFPEMRRIFSEWTNSCTTSTGSLPRVIEREEFLAKYYWTSQELIDAQYARQAQIVVSQIEQLLKQRNKK